MRPLLSVSDGITSRGARHGESSTPSAPPPMACFLTTEADLETAGDESGPSCHAQSVVPKRTVETVRRRTHDQHQSPRPASLSSAAASSSSSSSSSVSSFAPSVALGQTMSHGAQPLASLLAGLSEPESAISTSSSRRNSLLTASSFEYQDSYPASAAVISRSDTPHLDSLSSPGPQLIMPSLNVPRRRPFSDAGKSIGKLKLLVAGQSGIGKTSLIQSMAHACEHIVHMDPIGPSHSGHITEVYASTRAQPWWRNDSNHSGYDAAIRQRRPSTGDVLDRNLCFVDGSVQPDNSNLILRYIESRLSVVQQSPMNEADIMSLLSNGVDSTVDAVLYMLPPTGPSSDDIEHLKALQHMTNIIPLLARADEVGSETISESKERLRRTMNDENIECFSFSTPGSPRHIYAVSNVTHSDNDMMDASVLMSSEYSPPLISTDLSMLVGHLFSMDGSAWLRHSAASKCVQWRRMHGHAGTIQQTALSCRRGMMGGTMSPVLTANPFSQAQSWERVEVSDWARGLRQSLHAERVDQLSWQWNTGPDAQLCESSQAVVKQKQQQKQRDRRPRSRDMQHPINPHYQDPLGLLEIIRQAKRSGRVPVELVSYLGVVGCFTAWLMRHDQIRNQNLDFLSRWHMWQMMMPSH